MRSTDNEDTFSSVIRIVDLQMTSTHAAYSYETTTHISPLYSMTAPCVSDVRLIRSNGCSGTTLHSKYRIAFFVVVDVVVAPGCVLALLLNRSHGRESSPACFDRPASHSIALRRPDRRSSSSSVDKGKTNSWETPPGACTMHPRTMSVPGSSALPEMVTGWNEFAGTTTGDAFETNGTPDVLQDSIFQPDS